MFAKRLIKVLIRYMKLKNWFLFLCVVLATVWACGQGSDEEPEAPTDPNLGKSYFFLEQGKYREYNVYEIRYQAVDISDTLRYQLREEVGEAFESPKGQVSHFIRRYTRPTSAQAWELDSVWTARIEGDKAISVENNVPLIKMVFPADTSRRWDGNLMNSRQPVIQRFKTFNKPFTVGLNTFLEAAEIEISNQDDGITFRDIRREVYRDSIGLIYKFYNQVKLCSRPECLGQNKVESGRLYREELIAHGTLNEED
ncbi:hypothetical protein GCM10011340_32620 [Roseivirga thermotolerans]|jgi:hypothetical protein|uniref:Lipoprotein n=2 Tax=Roseivirgaceae TaxID=2762306 RepID=A0ABQ3ICP8_9BACT|nr:hypothetical protein GCM10011340_32620 [Roseivirga thermotolerans]|tara:strand:- start:1239 stop:2003 length:765 start_codon:yes stop_codon:yes gene_type:complete